MNLQTNQFNLYEIVKDELTNILVQSLWNSKIQTYKQISSIFIIPGDDLINRSDQSL
jgi:hypothetical protein